MGTISRPSEQPQKRQKADPGSAAGTASHDAGPTGAASEAHGQGTDQAADNGAGPEEATAQRDAASQLAGGHHARHGGSGRQEDGADGDGGSAGLTALLGDYGSDSDG